jgi:hypothetical protein
VSSPDRAHERTALRARYGALYDELLALLFRRDPIGINRGTNTDEYDAEVRAILPRLESCRSAADVARVAHEEFIRLFDPAIAGSRARYERIAPEIWELWCRRTSSSS